MSCYYLLVPVLCSCWLALLSDASSSDFFCSTSDGSPVILSNGPVVSSNFSYSVTIAKDFLFQTPFELNSSISVTALAIFPRQSNVSLTIRAALYDATSRRIAQTTMITVSTTEFSNTQPRAWTLPFNPPVNLTAGIGYHVAYWFDGSSDDGVGTVALFATSPAYAAWIEPRADFATMNGSLPTLLAAPYTFGTGNAAPFIQLIGSPCTNTVPTLIIRLNETILSVLEEIRSKYDKVPAMGASIIQTPSSQSYAGAQSPANAVCPFIPVSTVLSGVRRSDALAPEMVAANDKWHLGSDTKSMTAILIQMLIQAGKLSLNTTVGDVFPYLPFSSTSSRSSTSCACANLFNTSRYFAQSPYSCGLAIHTSWKHVTVAHLLTHTSGLEVLDEALSLEYYTESLALENNGTREPCSNYPLPSRHYHLCVLLPMAIPNPPLSVDVPVTSAYSNNNFILLGLILEEIWSLPWESIMQHELFDPLRMTTAGFGPPLKQVSPNSVSSQPFGHYIDAAGALHSTDADNLMSWGPAGTVHASLGDWSKFIACHLQEGRALTALGFAPINSSFLNATNSPYLLSPSMWQSVHRLYVFPATSAANSEHSLSGMITERDNLGVSLWHTGSNTAWYAYVVVYPELPQPMALLITANIADADAVWEAKAAIINSYLAWRQQGQPLPVITSTATLPPQVTFKLALILILLKSIHDTVIGATICY